MIVVFKYLCTSTIYDEYFLARSINHHKMRVCAALNTFLWGRSSVVHSIGKTELSSDHISQFDRKQIRKLRISY